MPKDISNMLPPSVNLEKTTLDKFGAAVDGQERLSFGKTTKSPITPTAKTHATWESSDYAYDLIKTGNVAFNPKLKFMFKVSFKFNPAIIAIAGQMGYSVKDLQEDVTFIVRHVDRPKHDFEYEEVNLYNFRTKVLKSIRNREVSLTIYDDVGNTALSLVNMYRQLIQPIARMQFSPSMAHEDYGFDFNSSNNTSFRGPLPNDVKNIIEEMTIHQIYVERGSDAAGSSLVKVVNFTFMNPKFTNIDVDDMDHENGGNFNIITFSVDYDSVFMDTAKQFNAETGGPYFKGGDVPENGVGGSSAQGGGKMGAALNQGYRDFAAPKLNTLSDGGASSVMDTVVGNKNKMFNITNQSLAKPTASLLVDNTVAPSAVDSLSSQESSDDGDFA